MLRATEEGGACLMSKVGAGFNKFNELIEHTPHRAQII